MKLIDKLANAWWMDQETDSLTEAYKDGFRAARGLAADLLDDALKWSCIEVDEHDRVMLGHQVTRIRQTGESEIP